MSKKYTYQEISKISGLSISTISRVFNKSPLVTEESRRAVLSALQTLGIDSSSYNLSPLPSDNLIIFNVPSLKNPFYSPIAEAARNAAFRHGYSLLINEDPLNDDSIDLFLNLLKKSRAAGLICANAITHRNLKRISDLIPTVTCCEVETSSLVPFVSIDDEVAAYNAVKHLVSLGKKRIAMINGPEGFKYARDRFKGYKAALEDSLLLYDSSLVSAVGADMDFDTAKALAINMLNSSNTPDAFFCISDVLAAAAIKAAFERGYKVPQDIAVVGFDNIFLSKIMNPSITTVRQPTSQIGSLALEMVIKLINKEYDSTNSIYLGTELIIRESTTITR